MNKNSRPFRWITAVAFSAWLFAVSGISGAEALWDEQRNAVEFALALERVAKASISDDGQLWIILDDQGQAELREISRANLGHPVQIMLAGHRVLRFTVFTELDSGRLRVQNPQPGLIEVLEPLL